MEKLLAQTEVIAAIIGAIVGGITGAFGSLFALAITEVLKNWGKLIILTNESTIIFSKPDGFGSEEILTNLAESKKIEIDIKIDIYNDSNKAKILSNFRIELVENRQKKIFSVHQYFRTPSGAPYSLSVPSQIIPPKQPVCVQCKSILNITEIACFHRNIDVNFLANSPKQVIFKTNILSFKKE